MGTRRNGAGTKKTAVEEECNFLGLGQHSFRHANLTWRQQVGGSSIKTSKISGHAAAKITKNYAVLQLRRMKD